MMRTLQNLNACINKVEATTAEIQERLEEIRLCHMGHQLTQRAGQAAVEAGQAEGPALFEHYEAAKETSKVLHDMRALAYIWPLASSPKGLQRLIDTLDLQTLTGRLASVRLVKYYDEVLAYEFQQMEEPVQLRI